MKLNPPNRGPSSRPYGVGIPFHKEGEEVNSPILSFRPDYASLQKKANGLRNASLHSTGRSRILAQDGSRRTKSNPLAALHVAD